MGPLMKLKQPIKKRPMVTVMPAVYVEVDDFLDIINEWYATDLTCIHVDASELPNLQKWCASSNHRLQERLVEAREEAGRVGAESIIFF